MTTLRIVQFETNQFAVQKRTLLRWGYCGNKNNYIWDNNKYILKYCIIPTLSQAEESLEYIYNKIKMDRELVKKIPRIVKVIKKVRV